MWIVSLYVPDVPAGEVKKCRTNRKLPRSFRPSMAFNRWMIRRAVPRPEGPRRVRPLPFRSSLLRRRDLFDNMHDRISSPAAAGKLSVLSSGSNQLNSLIPYHESPPVCYIDSVHFPFFLASQQVPLSENHLPIIISNTGRLS